MANGQDDPPPDGSWRGTYTFWLSLLVTAVYAAVLAFTILGLTDSNSVQRTRLLIVLTLIIAMLGFGGLLIARALFSHPTDQAAFQDRFRLAREIFLVFSGIFGTIIGFYFGAADKAASQASTDQPQVQVSWTDGQVTATITGGVAPFTGVLTPKDGTSGEVQKTDTRALTYKAEISPPDAKLTIVDGGGHLAEATVKCESEATGSPIDQPADNGEANASANGTNTESAPSQ